MENPFEKLNQKIDNVECLLQTISECLFAKTEKDSKEFLTLIEAADFLDLSKSSVYSKVSQGMITHIKKGKRLYFSKEDLISYLNQGKVPSIQQLTSSISNSLKF